MKLIIDSSLSEPPSHITCFRDVTLYAKTFIFEDILLECQAGTRTMYWNWLKTNGAHDFISYLIKPEEKEYGFSIKTKPKANIVVDRISYHNLEFIIKQIQALRH
tara:strand:+ start:951 stop:1265 length:315 start_codon:yes stop_codon:yes gene_type:complete